MNKKRRLNNNQRRFLRYLSDNYNCVGYDLTIPQILSELYYTRRNIKNILLKYDLCILKRDDTSIDYHYSLKDYPKPKKYFKIDLDIIYSWNM